MELVGPTKKIDRAQEHLVALDLETRKAFGPQPVFISPEFDDKDGSYAMRLRIREVGDTLRLGTIVGDLIHNLRSALDQAAWLVACRSNPVEKLWKPHIARQIAFPLTWKPRKFRSHGLLPFIADDAKAVFERLQPYKGGDTPKALGRLDTLWNIDKHRVIHQVALNVDISSVKFRPKAILVKHFPEETTWHKLEDRLEDGAKLATVKFRGGKPPETGVDVTGEPTATIGFGSGFFALPIEGIAALIGHAAVALNEIGVLPDEAPLDGTTSTKKGHA